MTSTSGSQVGLRGRLEAWRADVRRTRGGALALKATVLVLGVAFIALGVVLIVLPGPLTIPPILVGLYLLSTEFRWADNLLVRARKSGVAAWGAAQRRPVLTAATTLGGLAVAGTVIWAVSHYDLVGRARDAVGW